jgi:plasmid maintenance system antidote protein VapI
MFILKSSELIRKIMKDHNLTVEMMAHKLGVHRRSVHRLINGEKASGKLDLALICLYCRLNKGEISSH